MPTLSQIYPTYEAALRVMNDLEAAGVPATDITLVSGEKGAGARNGTGTSKAGTRAYAEAISRGGTLVSVRADDAQASRVEAILHVPAVGPTAGPDSSKDVREDLGARRAEPAVVRAEVSADQPLDTASASAFQDRVFEVRTTGEEPVVSKETRVFEEIIVRKDAADRVAVVRDMVRETKVDIEDSTTRR